MGPGFGEAVYRDLFRFVLLVVVVVMGAAFGVGYACNSCDTRLHIERRPRTATSQGRETGK